MRIDKVLDKCSGNPRIQNVDNLPFVAVASKITGEKKRCLKIDGKMPVEKILIRFHETSPFKNGSVIDQKMASLSPLLDLPRHIFGIGLGRSVMQSNMESLIR